MSVPNILTILRFLIIPVFGYYLYTGRYVTAAILFTAAGFTDILDGYIARKYNMVTNWGKAADPVADKLIVLTALVVLTIKEVIPDVIIYIIALKELLMGVGGYLLYRNKKRVESSNWYGKAATLIFYAAIILVIFDAPYSSSLLILAVAMAVFALIMYTVKYFKLNNKSDS